MIRAVNNALACEKEISDSSECLFSHVRDIARELLIKDGKPRYDEADLFSSEAFLTEYKDCVSRLMRGATASASPAKETESAFAGAIGGVRLMASVCLCQAMCELLSGYYGSVPLSEFFGDMTEPENSKIAYMRSSYSDVAYRAFAEALGHASVLYPESFTAVCEEVYYGRAGYCILPYETSDDGSLVSFLKLIHKYELAPIMTAEVAMNDPVDADIDGEFDVGRVTVFALLAKNVKRVSGELARRGIKSEEYLKISVDDPVGDTLSGAIAAAIACGLSHVKTESLPIPWDRGRYTFSLTFKVGGADVLPFLVWLKLSLPESSPDSLFSLLLS